MPAQAPLKLVPTSGSTGELREFAAGDFVDMAAGGTGATTAAGARTALGLGSAAVAPILGTVSQSGGVPTGAIVQRGSNANGEFVRFADGTQICTRAFSVTAAVNNPIGGIFQSTAIDFGTYAAAFVAQPSFAASVDSSDGYMWVVGGTAGAGFTAAGPRCVARGGSLASTTLYLSYIVIGRWF